MVCQQPVEHPDKTQVLQSVPEVQNSNQLHIVLPVCFRWVAAFEQTSHADRTELRRYKE
jgi:hypothetical protein